jgi:UPF0716 protein FxsA
MFIKHISFNEKKERQQYMPILLLFIIIPILEVYAFLTVGSAVGVLQTLALCVLTAIIGGILVRQQGLETLFKAQNNLHGGKLPVQELFDGFFLIISGVMLLTPGFVTDIAGFLLLLPPFRSFLRDKMANSGKFSVHTAHNTAYNDDIIDGEYEKVTPDMAEIEKREKNDKE